MINLNMPINVCADLQSCLQGKGPTPSYEIELCFGEEYPDPNVPKTKKLIMAQVSHDYVGKGPRIIHFSVFYVVLHIYSEYRLC